MSADIVNAIDARGIAFTLNSVRRAIRRKVRAARATPVWARRAVLAAVLLAVIFVPLPSPASVTPAPACRGCHAQPVDAERWAAALPGQWAAADGAAGTVPASGQAYVAVGGGLAVVGDGLSVSAYSITDGALEWQVSLSAPAGAAIASVRAWAGVVTAGITRASGGQRTEAVIDDKTGTVLRTYRAAVFGGAVAASPRTTVVVGPASVTSYDNVTGKPRWQLRTGPGQTWRADGDTLYVTQSQGGDLGSAPVTALQVIDLSTGAERTMDSPAGSPFSGTLAGATDGIVYFTSAAGVTAYEGSTGGPLWAVKGAVPEGTDPVAGLIYLTSASGALIGVDPLTGKEVTTVPGSATTGSAGMYVVRGGVALGLDSGASGDAWGYSVGAGRVTWTTAGLPWPHYFSDLSGVGGSASAAGSTVVIAACPRLAPAPSPSATPSAVSASASAPASPGGSAMPTPAVTAAPTRTATPTATPSPVPSAAPVAPCANAELVALSV
ncbi:MAG TPA: PQQ-binding-like beta-propeller repeat protein [Trebonia sp.]|jgi:hypothetical protein|nr:PQQ-binding-like beta-propeller repeat protein [Trebonia sp.]